MDTPSKIVVLLLLLGASVFSSCSKLVAPTHEIITIRGVHWACNVNTTYASFCSLAESELDAEVVLAASDGDLLYLANEDDQEFYYRYSRRDGQTLLVTFDTLKANTATVNTALKSLELSEHPDSWNSLHQLSDPERKQLSTLHITGRLTAERLTRLQQHENSLKGKGLMLEAACEKQMLGELLSICRPAWLMTNERLDFPDADKCAALSHMELLWMDGESIQDPELFARCSNLESLIVSAWDPGEQELLALSGLKRLHSLTLAESSLLDFSHVEFPASLRRLHVIDCDTLGQIDGIQHIRHLSGISFSLCPHIQGIGQLAAHGSLRWLGFPENVSQSELEALLSRLNKLEVIELLACEAIHSLSPLLQKDKLRVLHLDLPKEKLSDLGKLTRLDLLVLASEHFEKDPEWIAELRTNLPATRVVPGSGLCLGSGWILLMLPLVLLSRFLFLRGRSKAVNA